jgi:16S rRNA (guanine527-N7)-methyltransferase
VTEAEELESGALALGVDLDASQIERLVHFAALLRRWNAAFNLVSRRDIQRLAARHLLDSLSLVPMLVGRRALDLGTGAGLPGIPLAIARPDIEFTLLDRSERRIRFVRQATLDLGLKNVDPVSADYADFRPTSLFDTVVSRAVAKPAALWREASTLLALDGVALFQVGALERDSDPLDTDVESVSVHIPGLTQLHRVLRVRRHAVTPNLVPQDFDR